MRAYNLFLYRVHVGWRWLRCLDAELPWHEVQPNTRNPSRDTGSFQKTTLLIMKSSWGGVKRAVILIPKSKPFLTKYWINTEKVRNIWKLSFISKNYFMRKLLAKNRISTYSVSEISLCFIKLIGVRLFYLLVLKCAEKNKQGGSVNVH